MEFERQHKAPPIRSGDRLRSLARIQQGHPVGDELLDIVALGYENDSLEGFDRTQGNVSVPVHRLEELAIQIHQSNQLTQLLGVALREVVPYAQIYAVQEARLALQQIHADISSDNMAETKGKLQAVQDSYNTARRRVHRAQDALSVLNSTQLFVENLPEDAFDDAFQLRFED